MQFCHNKVILTNIFPIWSAFHTIHSRLFFALLCFPFLSLGFDICDLVYFGTKISFRSSTATTLEESRYGSLSGRRLQPPLLRRGGLRDSRQTRRTLRVGSVATPTLGLAFDLTRRGVQRHKMRCRFDKMYHYSFQDSRWIGLALERIVCLGSCRFHSM